MKKETNVVAPLQKAEPRTTTTQNTLGEQRASLVVLSATQPDSASYHPPDVAAPPQSLPRGRPTAPPQSATHISRSHRSSRRSRRSNRSSRRSRRSNRSSRRSRRSNRSTRSSRKSSRPVKKPVNQNVRDDMASTQSFSQREATISKSTVNIQAGGLERQSIKESREARIGKTQSEDRTEKADAVGDNQVID